MQLMEAIEYLVVVLSIVKFIFIKAVLYIIQPILHKINGKYM